LLANAHELLTGLASWLQANSIPAESLKHQQQQQQWRLS